MKLSHAMLAVTLAFGVSVGGLPVNIPGTSLTLSSVSEAQAQRYRRPPVRRRAPVRRSSRRGGAFAAGAIIGLAAGAIAANAARNDRRYRRPPPPRRGYCNYRACSYRYRSFDPASCTFQPYNGPRRYCRL
ncbi:MULTISPECIES: BA14K family protein [Cohaesibacter]|uniref:BA14K family protein n=1 Tax=Cohaesibacter TaxID=655352 RepID=UPI000DE9EEAE|nr:MULTISPECIES: BA14K family protein [Cohaesibacter]TLP43124.1 BA14K family protein [Cohaesibacter sp. CAU 1516]